MFNSWLIELKIVIIILFIFNFGPKVNSANCNRFQWQCDSGECIQYEDRCDGIPHCDDSSDETAEYCIHMYCPTYAFRCAYGGCITGTYMCNKRKDCVDGSDETRFLCDVNLNEAEIKAILKGSCNESQTFECKPGECISDEKRCDGKIDCSNRADEEVEICSNTFCSKLAFRCGNGACIPGNLRCNGIKDCFDGSDETAELCEPMEFPKPCRMPFKRDELNFYVLNYEHTIREGESVPYGTEIIFKCSKGWHLIGAKRIFCEYDDWSSPIPHCMKYCSKYDLKRNISITTKCEHNNRYISCNGPLPIGSIAKLSCAQGYTLDDNFKSKFNQALLCNTDGKWSVNKMKCSPRCGVIENSKVNNLPWDVSIFRLEGLVFKKQCMGVIVSPKIVLSAEKCFEQIRNPKPDEHEAYNIVAGKYNEDYAPNEDINKLVYNVSEIVITTYFRNYEYVTVLVLVNYFDFSKSLAPVCIQMKRFNTAPYLPITKNGKEKVVLNELGSGIYNVREEIYFLNAIVGSTELNDYDLRPINISYSDNIIKKYIERYNYLL